MGTAAVPMEQKGLQVALADWPQRRLSEVNREKECPKTARSWGMTSRPWTGLILRGWYGPLYHHCLHSARSEWDEVDWPT